MILCVVWKWEVGCECLRGDTYMTSAMRGREGVGQNVMIVLIGCVNGTVTRERGSKNPKFLRTS